MIRRLEILLLSSIIIIFSYPTARAGNHRWAPGIEQEIVQYGIFFK